MRTLPKLLPVLAFAVACSVPAPAAASTVHLETSTTGDRGGDPQPSAVVVVRALRGERNRIRVTAPGARIVIADAAGVTPGRGCRRQGRRAVACRIRQFFATDMRVALGDRSDTAVFRDIVLIGENGGELALKAGPGDDHVRSGLTEGELDGGPGRDLLRTRTNTTFVGGPGNDRMFGAGGSDEFIAGASPDGSDTMRGAGGDDVVSYARRSSGIRADLAGDRDDGARGERDRIAHDIEGLNGGSGGDVLVGDAGDNQLITGGGADVAAGGAGSDDLVGDESSPPDDPGDRLIGGPGFDIMTGGSGPDTILGGPGWDIVSGGAGGDRINLRDGARDDLECGEGIDAVTLDGFDFFTSLAGPCEGVQRDAPAGAIFNMPSSESLETPVGSPTAFASLGCPGDAPALCQGTVRLDVSGRTGEPVSFSIARDQSEVVKPALDDQAVEQAKRRGSVAATLVVETNQPEGGEGSRLVYRTRVFTTG